MSMKHVAETRPRHSLSGMFSFISGKVLTYSRFKTEKDKASYCSHRYFGISIHFPQLWHCLIFWGYANVSTLQNVLPVYYSLHQTRQPNN